LERFAFIIHPLDASYVARKFKIAKGLPAALVERVLRLVPPFTVSRITGIKSACGAEAEGNFVACPLTAQQMLELPEEFVLKRIIQSCRLAEKLGAKIVGLGAFTSVVGDAGITVAEHVNIAVTTGNSYTVAAAIEGTKLAAARMGIDLKTAEVLIVGATGSIGSICARIMAREVNCLNLVDKHYQKLSSFALRLMKETGVAAKFSTDLTALLPRADVIMTMSSAVDELIDGTLLKPGAVVCDIARPRDVSRQIAEVRKDVLVIDGGVIEVPGNVNFNFDFGFPPGLAYACMAETMLLCLERRYENFTLGRELSIEQVEEIAALAAKHGFKLAGLRGFDRYLDDATLARIKGNAMLQKRATKELKSS